MENQVTKITVEAVINASVAKVWEFWTGPAHIVQWNSASEDWHTPSAENDLRVGGKFLSVMAARDGSFSFDFWGVYDVVDHHQRIAYTMGDGRTVDIVFEAISDEQTRVIETFVAETENSVELQREGWQAILNNFKNYAEAN